MALHCLIICLFLMFLSFNTLIAYGCMTCLCTSSTSDHNAGQETMVVMDEDLEHLCNLLQAKYGGPTCHQVMDRSTPTMYYQAWCRDPVVVFYFFQIDTKAIVILTVFKLLSSACNLHSQLPSPFN